MPPFFKDKLEGGHARAYSTNHMKTRQGGLGGSENDGAMAAGHAGSLSGRRALVVGGTGGIGAALARSLAARGASLIVQGGASQERLDALVGELSASGAAATGFLLPLECPEDLVKKLPELGRIDILAVAFGPFLQKPLHEMSAAEWSRLALLDLALPGAAVSALLPSMAERGYGRIILFGGTRTDAIRAYSTNAAYAAAKTGLAVLVKSVAAGYAASNVGAFLLCPGLVDTEYLGEPLREALRAKAPGGRLIEPEEIGEFGAELAAADPCIASGAVVNLDGGIKL
jgi:NAD(P)-dependent dehydrogenase (short-subunit alcohol dehydrogenase family)